MVNITRYDPSASSNTTDARIQRAITTAALSEMKQRHGAMLYSGGRLVAAGINIQRNVARPYIPYKGISTHAEINCLRGIRTNVSGVLYLARISPGGSILNSAPCNWCEAYITEHYPRITEIIHT